MTTVEKMKYHGPGWKLDTRRYLNQVWAPNEKRSKWAAAWTGDYANLGGEYVQGDTLEEVLTIFTPGMAAKFRTAIEKREEK